MKNSLFSSKSNCEDATLASCLIRSCHHLLTIWLSFAPLPKGDKHYLVIELGTGINRDRDLLGKAAAMSREKAALVAAIDKCLDQILWSLFVCRGWSKRRDATSLMQCQLMDSYGR